MKTNDTQTNDRSSYRPLALRHTNSQLNKDEQIEVRDDRNKKKSNKLSISLKYHCNYRLWVLVSCYYIISLAFVFSFCFV